MNQNLSEEKKDIKPERPDLSSNRRARKTGGGGFLFEPGLKNGFFGETEQRDFAQLPIKRKVTISFKGTILTFHIHAIKAR